MKHLLYLQLRRSLLEQQIQCDIDQHVALSGLALQSEFGDYSDQVSNTYGYRNNVSTSTEPIEYAMGN